MSFTKPQGDNGNGTGAKPTGVNIIDQLNQAFPPEKIKTRVGRGNKNFDYVEGAAVIRRLNDTFGHRWGFEIVSSHETDGVTKQKRDKGGNITETIIKREIICHGRLTTELGTHDDFGHSVYDGGGAEIGHAYKSAATDAIKRCAHQLGIGLELYEGDDELHSRTNGNGRSSHAAPRDDSGEAATGQQIDFLVNIAKRCGLDVDHDGFTTPSGVGVPFATLTKGHAAAYIKRLQEMEAAQ